MDDERTRARVSAASLRVPFRDVDMHGHVHDAVYCSAARRRSTDTCAHTLIEYFSPDEAGLVYPVRKIELGFNCPSRFEDKIDFSATVVWVCVDAARRTSTGIPERTREVLAPLVAGEG